MEQICNLLPSAYFFIFLSLDYVHIFAHICIPVLFFRLSCRGKRRFWSWRICVPKTTLTTAASPLSETCVAFLTAVLSSDLPTRQVLHIITDFCAQKAHCNQIIISLKKERCRKRKMNCHASSQLSYSVTVITAKAVHLPPVYHRCSLFPQHPRPSNCW